MHTERQRETTGEDRAERAREHSSKAIERKKQEGEGRLKDILKERQSQVREKRRSETKKASERGNWKLGLRRQPLSLLNSCHWGNMYWHCSCFLLGNYIYTHSCTQRDVHILGHTFLAEEMPRFSCGEVFSNRGVAQNNEPMKGCTMWFTQAGTVPGISYSEAGTKNTGTKGCHDILFQMVFSVYILPPMQYGSPMNNFSNSLVLSKFFLMTESKRFLNAWVYIWTSITIHLLTESTFKYRRNVTDSFSNFQSIIQIIVLIANNWFNCSKETQKSLRHINHSYVQLMN